MQVYQFLGEKLATSKQDISKFVLSAPKKYKVYSIPKRTSGKRIIAHPSKMLKNYQRALTILLEKHFLVHNAAFAYKKNTSIKDNATQHKNSEYLLKMDFQSFFHSISPSLFFSIANNFGINLQKEDIYLLRQILFWSPSKRSGGKLVLSIGAPSSPLISNTIMFFFDQALTQTCENLGIIYTRYADDITFSTNERNILFDIPALVKSLLQEHFNGAITINEGKTVFSSKSHNRHVTGVTITNNGKLSIGRQRKRYISSLIHKYSLNQLSSDDVDYLQGLFSFACNIEPDFKYRMIKKYSLEIVDKVVKVTK